PAFSLDFRYSPRPKILGTVVMALAVRQWLGQSQEIDRSSLYIYRVLKEDFNERAHEAFAELTKGTVRPWLDSNLNRSDTEVFGMNELLIEVRNGQLLPHEVLFR